MLRIAVAAGLIGLALPAGAAERVQFESARYQLGPLQLRLARERGETVARPPAEIISGYLTKPNGAGPFPAVVHLHGCNGLSKAFKSGSTIPIKLLLANAVGQNVSSASITVTAVRIVQTSTDAISDVQDSGNANPDNNFRFDSGGYIFNLSTKGLATGSYNLEFTISGDPTSHSVPFQLR